MVEIELAGPEAANPYVEVSAEVVFTHEQGLEVVRPAFWDGGTVWRVRFAAPVAGGTWRWRADVGGVVSEGTLPAQTVGALLRMSPKGRNAVWTDGSGFFPVTDTAWALPWRATHEQATVYAADRRAKGFTAALLMTVQPDTQAEGPESRTEPEGFARGFDDLGDGRLQRLRPDYFRYLDGLVRILLDHGIVPIHTPLFYGFGWKGLDVIGPRADPEEAGRFARYLVARYGAWPAMWLVGADGTGWEPAVAAMGEAVEAVDAYRQPTGIHYNPWQSSDAHWDEPWCDFHLCQTGHGGDHRPDRVAVMHHRRPVRAVANGEPTYEGMGGGAFGNGAWQAEEAWQNVTLGGTFGAFYGAASLWQWRLAADEPGWGDWCIGPFGWREALDLPGSRYPGLVARVLEGVDWVDMEANLELARGQRCVAVPGRFALVYLPDGGPFHFKNWRDDLPYRALDALTGEVVHRGWLSGREFMGAHIELPTGRPLAVVVGGPALD